MATFLIHPGSLQDQAAQIARRTAAQLTHAEAWGDTLFLALTWHGHTTAVTCTLTPLLRPDGHGHTHAVLLTTEADNPTPCQVTPHLLRALSPLPAHAPSPWRARAHAWTTLAATATTGERLLGEYPGAHGFISDNEPGKAAYQRDGQRFLKRVLTHLGGPGTVTFNAGGPAVSGDHTLRAGPLTVRLHASGNHAPRGASPSGVTVCWEVQGGRVQHEPWDVPARTLAHALKRARPRP